MRRFRLDRVFAAVAVVTVLFFVLPLIAIAFRTPWTDLLRLLRQPEVTEALRLSLIGSVTAVVASLVLGVPTAWVLARKEFPGRDLVRALVVLPMVLPPVVGGVALLLAYGRRGLVGRPLAAVTGLTLPFTTPAVTIAATFVAMPFLVISLESAFRSLDPRYEEAAASLGASHRYRFRRVILPLVLPSLVSGIALTWARALGEFGATITFAGNLPGRTQTMPLAVFLELENNPDAAYLLSMLLLSVSLVVLFALRGRYLTRT